MNNFQSNNMLSCINFRAQVCRVDVALIPFLCAGMLVQRRTYTISMRRYAG